jgi:hypothetical protein
MAEEIVWRGFKSLHTCSARCDNFCQKMVNVARASGMVLRMCEQVSLHLILKDRLTNDDCRRVYLAALMKLWKPHGLETHPWDSSPRRKAQLYRATRDAVQEAFECEAKFAGWLRN